MTDYVLDLAFDADETREYQGLGHPLQAGLVTVTNTGTGQGSPQWFTQLESGSLLHFRVWDISQVTQNSILLDFWAGFFAPLSTSRLANPLVDPATGQSNPTDPPNPQVFGGSQLFPNTDMRTSVYAQCHAGWAVGEDSALGTALTLKTVTAPERYVLQVRIEIRTPSGDLRTYVYDPEVVIGGSGG